MSAKERLQPLSLNPEMASLDCGSLNFGDSYFINDHPLMRSFALEMSRRGIFPELECFEGGHIHNALRLRDEGLLPNHLHFNLVLGVPGALPASPENLIYLTSLLPEDASWTLTAVGKHQLPLSLVAMAAGGHVRVGLEDNIFLSKGILSEGNAPFVARTVRIAAELGRRVAGPDEVRQIFSLKQEKA